MESALLTRCHNILKASEESPFIHLLHLQLLGSSIHTQSMQTETGQSPVHSSINAFILITHISQSDMLSQSSLGMQIIHEFMSC